jgi:hypothetical protein
MKRTCGPSLAVVASVAFLLLFPTLKHNVPIVHAQSGCSAGTLTGSYGFVQPAGFIASGHSVKVLKFPGSLRNCNLR